MDEDSAQNAIKEMNGKLIEPSEEPLIVKLAHASNKKKNKYNRQKYRHHEHFYPWEFPPNARFMYINNPSWLWHREGTGPLIPSPYSAMSQPMYSYYPIQISQHISPQQVDYSVVEITEEMKALSTDPHELTSNRNE